MILRQNVQLPVWDTVEVWLPLVVIVMSTVGLQEIVAAILRHNVQLNMQQQVNI